MSRSGGKQIEGDGAVLEQGGRRQLAGGATGRMELQEAFGIGEEGGNLHLCNRRQANVDKEVGGLGSKCLAGVGEEADCLATAGSAGASVASVGVAGTSGIGVLGLARASASRGAGAGGVVVAVVDLWSHQKISRFAS
ncbi:unnamed protein product [Ilex paraguariensis]|uniref:Uncharacterized protein n=1 Tax=Ilex paraguariensis TaxID=185542 RepID=A0ABC8SP20_9AQUA